MGSSRDGGRKALICCGGSLLVLVRGRRSANQDCLFLLFYLFLLLEKQPLVTHKYVIGRSLLACALGGLSGSASSEA